MMGINRKLKETLLKICLFNEKQVGPYSEDLNVKREDVIAVLEAMVFRDRLSSNWIHGKRKEDGTFEIFVDVGDSNTIFYFDKEDYLTKVEYLDASFNHFYHDIH